MERFGVREIVAGWVDGTAATETRFPFKEATVNREGPRGGKTLVGCTG
jgi:hypothetical protein